jgi:hypothetical protein
MDQEFNAAEVIAGFPLLSIRRALLHVGMMPDRDDIKLVAESLGCRPNQAESVLQAMERRGLVTKAQKKRQWEVTDLGRDLRWHWKPPRRMQPVIDRDDDSDAVNEGFEIVWCSLLRTQRDDSAMFEEAQFEVGVFVEYDTDRVVELSVVQPDDYDHPDSSSTIETSVYLSVTDAKKFAQGLQTAIEHAEAEITRRATAKPRRRRRTREPVESEDVPSSIGDTQGAESSRDVGLVRADDRGVKTKASSTSAARAAATARAAAAADKREQARKKREKNALASTLAELNRGR